METLVNKVAESGIVSLDLETFLPKEDITVFDLKDYLFMGMILKEKDFRESVKNIDLQNYSRKIVTITCSADAVIPMWAYMLVASAVEPVATNVFFGTKEEATEDYLLGQLAKLDVAAFENQRVVIKGCGDRAIAPSAYVEITKKLRPVTKSIMYGEPCSTVPVFKKKPDPSKPSPSFE